MNMIDDFLFGPEASRFDLGYFFLAGMLLAGVGVLQALIVFIIGKLLSGVAKAYLKRKDVKG